MKKHIQTTNPIAASAADVWAQIRTGEGVDKWLPPVTACRVEGNRRYCEAGEASLEETIESVDDKTMTFKYTIQKQTLMPVDDIAGEMRVEAVDANNCLLHWDVKFTVLDESMADAVDAGTRELYAGGALGLQQLAVA